MNRIKLYEYKGFKKYSGREVKDIIVDFYKAKPDCVLEALDYFYDKEFKIEDVKSSFNPKEFLEGEVEYYKTKLKNPIVVLFKPDGSINIQDGNHRVALAKTLGMETLPAFIQL